MDFSEALQVLSTPKAGSELRNVKFFLGDDRNVTHKELVIEAAKGVEQLNKGQLTPVDNIDGDMKKTPITYISQIFLMALTPLQRLIGEVSENGSYPVSALKVKKWIIENGYEGEIHFCPCDFDPNILKGQLRQEFTPANMYAANHSVSNILFSKGMTRCWQRFVCVKEMIHIFDPLKASTNTYEEIERLTSHLANPPPTIDTSIEYAADMSAQYKAMLVLAPLKLVNSLKAEYAASGNDNLLMAQKLLIPENYVEFIFSSDYPRIYNVLYNLG